MTDKNRFMNHYLHSSKGITLVALVITIIVLIILSAVSINALWGESGVITQAQEAAFRAEIVAIKEKVDLYNAAKQVDNDSEVDINLEKVPGADAENWKGTLKFEILVWGNYNIPINKLTQAYAETPEYFTNDVIDNGTAKDIYYIDENGDGSKEYIYNKETDIVYKIVPTRISKYTVHSIEELDFMQKGGSREKRLPKNYTKISYSAGLVEVSGLKYYEPDLNNVAKEATSLIFYKVEEKEDGTLAVTEDTKEVSANEWLEGTVEGLNKKRGNTITTEDGTTYVLYDYKNQIWANMKIESGDLETHWVWIPRYAYNEESATATDTQIIFVDTENKPIDNSYGSELPTGYAVAGKFKDNNQLGIWGSKYEPSAKVQKDSGYYEYYIPDLSGFNKENVYIQIYNKETDSFEREVQASTITNLSEFSKENLWFDYENKIWANIKVVNDGLETWWVWIPRYAYNESGTTDETDVIFVDTNNEPIDGSKLPSGYVVAGKFKDNKQLGIWGSKYEPSAQIVHKKETIQATSIDLSGFNKENVYIQIYNKETDSFEREVQASTIENLNEFSENNLWFDYENNIWANIKVVNNGLETWWVWIPRYAYNEFSTTDETDVIFVDENNNPIDGSKLPYGYVIAGKFKDNKQLGIWGSKYEPSEVK